MILIFLFLLGLLGFGMDIYEKKRPFKAILWNNFRYSFIISCFYVFIMNYVITIYTMEKTTGVITRILDMGWYGYLSWGLISLIPYIGMIIIGMYLMFKDIPYEEIKE